MSQIGSDKGFYLHDSDGSSHYRTVVPSTSMHFGVISGAPNLNAALASFIGFRHITIVCSSA